MNVHWMPAGELPEEAKASTKVTWVLSALLAEDKDKLDCAIRTLPDNHTTNVGRMLRTMMFIYVEDELNFIIRVVGPALVVFLVNRNNLTFVCERTYVSFAVTSPVNRFRMFIGGPGAQGIGR